MPKTRQIPAGTIGARLRAGRKRKKMTLTAVGRRLGVSPQAVAAWEYGKAEPSIDALCIIARLFEMKLDEVLGVENHTGVLQLADKFEEVVELMPRAIGMITDGEARSVAPDSGLYVVQLNEGDAAKIVGRVLWTQKREK
jgi:transcriptional regulator with XRE-family HTH domain